MKEQRKLIIFGDSIVKGVTYQDGRYHLCQAHNFDTLAARGITVCNYAKMGACTDTGLAIAQKRLAEEGEAATVLLSFGGNDCDFDWQAISDRPGEAHLPKIPEAQFQENYRALVRLAKERCKNVVIASLVPLEAHRFLDHVSQGKSRENILAWLGDVDRIFRWQEYYNDLACKLSRAVSCPLLDLRTEFLKSPVFPSLISADGIHPTQKGHDLVHRCVEQMLG